MGEAKTFVSVSAATAACLASLLTFEPHIRPYLNAGTSPLSAVWAMISVQPLLSETAGFALRSCLSAVVAAGPAMLLLSTGRAFRYAATVLSIPFPFFYAMCDESCRTPLQRLILPPAALVSHYAVMAFGPEDRNDAWRHVGEFALHFSVGGFSAVLAQLFFTALLCRRESFCVSRVDDALRECMARLLFSVEGVVVYFTTGGAHREELEQRLQAFREGITAYEVSVKAWEEEAWSDKPKAEKLEALQAKLVAAYALQAALLETFEDGYSELLQTLQLAPVAVELEDLRLSILAPLRLMVHGGEELDGAPMAESLRKAELATERFQQALHRHRVQTLSRRTGRSSFQDLTARELARSEFSQLALRRLAGLTGELHSALHAADIHELAGRGLFSSRIGRNLMICVCDFFAKACDSEEYFQAQPADTILDGGAAPSLKTRARRLLKFPLRLALTCHLAAILLIAAGDAFPAWGHYAFWAELPVILCFLPTTGAAVQKSLRRAVGTLVGGVVALGCLYWNAQNPPALLMQLFMVTFAAKYTSTFETIAYGGLVFGLTWHVVVLGSWHEYAPGSTAGLAVPLWRIGMTALGVVLTILASLTLWPSHATVEFEQRTAEALLCTTEICAVASEAALPTVDVSKEQESSEVCCEAVAPALPADLESFVRLSATERRVLLSEGVGELWIVPRVFPDLQALHDASEVLANAASAIRCNGAALNDTVVQAFYASAQKCAPEFKQSLTALQDALRQAAFTLALQLRRVRAPRGVSSRCKLLNALKHMENSWANARQEVLAKGEMASFIPRGLDTFYSTLYGLLKYTELWLSLEGQLTRPKEKDGAETASSTTELDEAAGSDLEHGAAGSAVASGKSSCVPKWLTCL